MTIVSSQNFDPNHVVIVGAGPVGLSLALFLVSKGVPATVLEAEPTLPTDMRASTFHPPTVDMLEPFGVADALVAEGHQAPQWQYYRTDTNDSAVFDLGVISDLTSHPYRLQCEQFRLTKIIVETLKDNPLFDIRFGACVNQVEDRGDDVYVSADIDGETVTFTGAICVGADGARSAVRQCLGFELDGQTYPRTSITVVVDFPFENHLPNMLYVNYVWTATDHYSLMRVKEYWRTGFSPNEDQTTEEALSDENIQRHLNRILPSDEPYKLVHRGAYTVHQRITKSFRKGRILLAGDAAHLNNPSGGMGMNSGVHDAHNAAEKIIDVLNGGSLELFDLYSRQRRTVATDEVQKRADKNYRRLRERDPKGREEVWQELKDIANDKEKMREFLLGTSMIASLQRAAEIQ